MNGDLTNTYGKNLVFPASEFTQGMQEHIINNYFNGTGSAYDAIHTHMANIANEAQQPQQPLQQAQQPAANGQVMIDQAELNRLKGIEQYARNLNPVQNQTQSMNPTQVQNEQPQQTATQANPAQNEFDLDKFMNDLMGNGASGTTTQQPVQPQSQNQSNESQAEVAQLIAKEAALTGLNPQEVIGFVQNLSPQDIVRMFQASKQQAPVQQAPVQQSYQQPVQQPVQQQYQQTYQQPAYNPYQQQPAQPQGSINLTDIPSAEQSGVNLAFPPQAQVRSVFS